LLDLPPVKASIGPKAIFGPPNPDGRPLRQKSADLPTFQRIDIIDCGRHAPAWPLSRPLFIGRTDGLHSPFAGVVGAGGTGRLAGLRDLVNLEFRQRFAYCRKFETRRCLLRLSSWLVNLGCLTDRRPACWPIAGIRRLSLHGQEVCQGKWLHDRGRVLWTLRCPVLMR